MFSSAVLTSRRTWLIWLAVGAQLMLVMVAFNKLVFHPEDYLFVTYYDGIKSYFSVKSYLNQPLSDGLMFYKHMNYPFGECMLYTDNTPLLTLGLHLLSSTFPGLKAYELWLYNLFMLGSIVASTYLLYRILSTLLHYWPLALLFSLVLPWINPQLLRLEVGHLSLSLSAPLLFAIYCLLRIYQSSTVKGGVKWSLILAAGTIFSAFLHMYYVALLPMISGFFLFFWFVRELFRKKPWKNIAVYAGLGSLLPLAATMVLLRAVDMYYDLRLPFGTGYGWTEWKLNFGSIFTPYPFNKVRFLFESMDPVPYESYAYLGGFALYGGLIIAALYWYEKRKNQQAFPEKDKAADFLVLLGAASLPLLMVALGESYEFNGAGIRFVNYLNVFYYLHKVSERVTQFRALGRFYWPFFWAFNFAVLYLADRKWANPGNAWWIRGLLAAIVLPGIIDLKDHMHHYRQFAQRDNILHQPVHLQQMKELMAGINADRFQAILPVPYYHSGSEGDYTTTIDPEDSFCNRTYQLSLITNLPLMASKATRTPRDHAHALFSIFSIDGMNQKVRSRMNDKPVLVFYDDSFYNGSNNFYQERITLQPARTVIDSGKSFVQRPGMKKLSQIGTLALYEWQLK